MICLQETKREHHLDIQFLKKFCPSSFDCFEYLPSVGASGGIVTIWKSHLFHGHLIFSNEFGLSVQLSSTHNDVDWVLTNVYGPCDHSGKQQFIHWLKHIQMPAQVNWLLVGYFNLMRKSEDRNRPGVMLLKCSFLMKPLVPWAFKNYLCKEGNIHGPISKPLPF